MARQTVSSDLARLILQISRAQDEAMMTSLAERGFTDVTSAFATVIPFIEADGVRSTALAKSAGVTKQAMSQLIRLLETRHYVEQVQDPMDTRAKVVRLTKRGVAVKRACREVREEFDTSAAKALGKKNLARFKADLSEILALYTDAPEQEDSR